MSEKKRLREIGYRIRETRERMGLTQEQFAEKFGYLRSMLGKLEAGLRDIKSKEMVTLAKQLNVSCDYLLGRTRTTAPDDLTQAAVDRYGLTEEALSVLEYLNKPLVSSNLTQEEREKVCAKETDYMSSPGADFTTLPLSIEEQKLASKILIERDNKNVLCALNEVLTIGMGQVILSIIYEYCHGEFRRLEWRTRMGEICIVTPDRQRQLELLRLQELLMEFREDLKGANAKVGDSKIHHSSNKSVCVPVRAKYKHSPSTK